MKKVLLRGPILTKSGYGQHFRQIARWFFENKESLPYFRVSFVFNF